MPQTWGATSATPDDTAPTPHDGPPQRVRVRVAARPLAKHRTTSPPLLLLLCSYCYGALPRCWLQLRCGGESCGGDRRCTHARTVLVAHVCMTRIYSGRRRRCTKRHRRHQRLRGRNRIGCSTHVQCRTELLATRREEVAMPRAQLAAARTADRAAAPRGRREGEERGGEEVDTGKYGREGTR